MKLYEISKEMQEVLLLLEREGEVDTSTLEEYLNQLEQDYTNKLDNIACMIKNEQAVSDAIDNEVKNLLERKKQHENKANRLKEYVGSFMQQMGLNKLETARNKLSFRKSEITIVDEEIFKTSYPQMVEKIILEVIPSKTDLKELFKSGKIKDGVTVEEKQNLQIK